MRKKLVRTAYALIALFFLGGSRCNTRQPEDSKPAGPATMNAPGQRSSEIFVCTCFCIGGDAVAAHPSSQDRSMAQTLAYAIRHWRMAHLMPDLIIPPDHGVETVAFYHAEDMSGGTYVNLVASDGENVSQHLACMGEPIFFGGASVVGQSNNVADVLNTLTSSDSGRSVLSLTALHIAVGYSDGYWCIIIY